MDCSVRRLLKSSWTWTAQGGALSFQFRLPGKGLSFVTGKNSLQERTLEDTDHFRQTRVVKQLFSLKISSILLWPFPIFFFAFSNGHWPSSSSLFWLADILQSNVYGCVHFLGGFAKQQMKFDDRFIVAFLKTSSTEASTSMLIKWLQEWHMWSLFDLLASECCWCFTLPSRPSKHPLKIYTSHRKSIHKTFVTTLVRL